MQQRLIVFSAALLAICLTFYSPTWITLFGVSPCWVILWLLPWSLKNGESSGVVSGLFLGQLLDVISLGNASHIPSLVALGFWWGRLGRKGAPIRKNLVFGLLSIIGTILFGLSLWLQTMIFEPFKSFFSVWGIQTLLAQSFITGLLAPLICTWIFFILRPRTSL